MVVSCQLKKLIRNLISDSRHAFKGDRQILEAILNANELVDSRLKCGLMVFFASWISIRFMATYTCSLACAICMKFF